MGYTHYYTVGRAVSNVTWNKFKQAVANIIKESGVSIHGGDGTGEPIINDKEISFNGNDETDQSHETFIITRGSGSWDFCKTAKKDYDVVVVATLMTAKKLKIIEQWSSDGDAESGDFDAATNLLETIAI